MTKTEMKADAMMKAALKKLPARARCPKCRKVRAKKLFGLRCMARDSKGLPTAVRRQSYCVTCRS